MKIEREKKLIQRILDGDRDAYAEVVDAYARPIHKLAFRMTGRREEAEELAQEIFIRAYEKLALYDRTRPFLPWLYSVALNLIRNYRRRSALRNFFLTATRSITHRASPDGNPEALVAGKQKRLRLARCIEGIPPHRREAVVLRYYQELSFKEIAEVQRISLSAAKMRVYRGLQELAALMAQTEGDHETAARSKDDSIGGE